MKKYLVDPRRALQIWNSTNETPAQIAERFSGVHARHVLESIEYAVESGLGGLARQLPERVSVPQAKPRSEFRRPRADKFAPIPDNIARCAAFNPEVEEILAEKDAAEFYDRRTAVRWLEDLLIEWATFVMDGGYEEWCGKTPYPWIDADRIKIALERRGRNDLWDYLENAWRTYCARHPKVSLEILESGDMKVRTRTRMPRPAPSNREPIRMPQAVAAD